MPFFSPVVPYRTLPILCFGQDIILITCFIHFSSAIFLLKIPRYTTTIRKPLTWYCVLNMTAALLCNKIKQLCGFIAQVVMGIFDNKHIRWRILRLNSRVETLGGSSQASQAVHAVQRWKQRITALPISLHLWLKVQRIHPCLICALHPRLGRNNTHH